MVYQLFYVSQKADNSIASVKNIVDKSTENNSKYGISGAILLRNNTYLQLLEGEKKHVRTLFDEKIKSDPRHKNIIEIFAIENNPRIFKNWSMAHFEVTDLDLKMINEILSWTNLISRKDSIDNKLILNMLKKFQEKLGHEAA